MRERLVRSDKVECVIGLGPNLFYNSPMEACIMICRMNKRPERRGQVLFINAVNEVERKNAQSYLEERHIARIAAAYDSYVDDADFAKVATIQDIANNNFSLSIPLYVKPEISCQQYPLALIYFLTILLHEAQDILHITIIRLYSQEECCL